jgi:hypothetical protein
MYLAYITERVGHGHENAGKCVLPRVVAPCVA